MEDTSGHAPGPTVASPLARFLSLQSAQQQGPRKGCSSQPAGGPGRLSLTLATAAASPARLGSHACSSLSQLLAVPNGCSPRARAAIISRWTVIVSENCTLPEDRDRSSRGSTISVSSEMLFILKGHTFIAECK